MRRVARFSWAWVLCAAVLPGAVVWGQGNAGAGANGPTVVKVVVSASAIGKPALKWMLLPQPAEMQEGNAAVQYGMAITEYLWSQQLGPHSVEQDEAIDKLLAAPLAELDVAAAKQIAESRGQMLRELRDGARRQSCSWELNIRQEGVYTLLPYLSPMRGMCRLLTLAIRVDIKNHDWEGAQDKLQTGYAVAQQMAHGQTIIETLVGAAIAGQMNNCVKDWIGEAGSPNLFWGIAEMPSPITPLGPGITWERSFIYFDLPEWTQMMKGEGTPELFAGMVGHFMRIADGAFGTNPAGAEGQRGVFENPVLAATGLAVIEYPQAKKFLIERGAKPEEVEKRGVASVVGEFITRGYAETADELFKWVLLPSDQAVAGMGEANKMLAELPSNSAPNMLARWFLPALGRAVLNATKPDRQLRVMRIVEGVRDYAAVHHGLPGSVEEMGLPVAVDPVTGKPFGFERSGEMVVITGEAAGAGGAEGVRWEISVGGMTNDK